MTAEAAPRRPTQLQRVPPHDPQLEAWLLGAAMLDRTAT